MLSTFQMSTTIQALLFRSATRTGSASDTCWAVYVQLYSVGGPWDGIAHNRAIFVEVQEVVLDGGGLIEAQNTH